MRAPRLLLCTAASLALIAGCSAPAAAPSAEASPSASSEPSSGGAEASSEPADGDAPATAPGVLMATVGTEEDPGAFEITLTDADGEPVTTVPAGDWTIEVQDWSKIHNVHLTGAGVDETTTVSGTGPTSWEVSLEAGDYAYVCDPHAGTMAGTLTVT